MRLILIRHIRCNETDWERQTLVWAPDDATDADVDARARRARDAYLQTLKDHQLWRKQQESGAQGIAGSWFRLWGAPAYHLYPDKTATVAQIDEASDRWKAAYRADEETQERFRRTFAEYLQDEGLTRFVDHEPDQVIDVDWGHNHGLGIAYEGTPFDTLKGPMPHESL